jgi:hypothetical protein
VRLSSRAAKGERKGGREKRQAVGRAVPGEPKTGVATKNTEKTKGGRREGKRGRKHKEGKMGREKRREGGEIGTCGGGGDWGRIGMRCSRGSAGGRVGTGIRHFISLHFAKLSFPEKPEKFFETTNQTSRFESCASCAHSVCFWFGLSQGLQEEHRVSALFCCPKAREPDGQTPGTEKRTLERQSKRFERDRRSLLVPSCRPDFAFDFKRGLFQGCPFFPHGFRCASNGACLF